ncbi:MAG: ATP-dependent DNA helicase, partial [Dolichospermum sp.]
WPSPDFQGLLLISPAAWLKGQLADNNPFPAHIPTIIDGVDDLEDWVRSQLTKTIQPHDWDELMLAYPYQVELIREAKVQLTHQLFQHPENPYHCYLISQSEIEILQRLYLSLEPN